MEMEAKKGITKENTKERESKKKPIFSSENKDYLAVDERILTGKSTFSTIKKTKNTIKDTLEQKPAKKQQESITEFGKVLFLNLKDAKENSIVANKYLYEITKDYMKNNEIYDGLYKIDVVKKEKNGIICRINGGKFIKTFLVSNEKIEEKKKKHDTLEGKFLIEIEENDSVIMDKKWEKVEIVHPDDIVDEIRKYISKKDNDSKKATKIQTAMKFFNDSKNKLAEEYLEEYLAFMHQEKKNSKKDEKTIITELINKENAYVHEGNDIDKWAVKLLLDKFWPKEKKSFALIDHNKVQEKTRGIFYDVGGTANGIKIEKTNEGTKVVVSEHTDNSDKALFSNRPSSTTQMIFTLCKRLGTIEEKDLPQVERFVNFINTVDSMFYQISSIDYPNNYQTLIGLHRSINIYDMFKYFKNPDNNGFEKLPEEYMKKTNTIDKQGKRETRTLWELSQTHKTRIEKNIKKCEEAEKTDRIVHYAGQKFIVDISPKKEDHIQDWPQTAGYAGYGYFSIKPEKGNIYMYSPKKLPPMIEGFHTEGDNHFLIINNPTKKDGEKITEAFWTKNSSLKEEIMHRIASIEEKKDTKELDNEDIALRCQKLLPALTENDIKIGKKYLGIINNVSGKKIFVNITPTTVWVITKETKEKELTKGEMINVRINTIVETNGKLRLSLEQVN